MKLSLTTTLLAILATQAAASYLGSCSNCYLEKWSNDWLSGNDEAPVLHCDCRRTNGESRGTSLDLNNCIANVDGNLAAREGGNMGQTCNMFSLRDGRTFSAFCGTGR